MKDGAVPFYAIGAALLLGALHLLLSFEYYRFEDEDSKQFCKPAITKGKARVGREAAYMKAEDIVAGRVVRFRVGRMGSESTSRVVATAGQVVSIVEGLLQIDGAPAPDPWGRGKRTHDFLPEMLVPAGCVFLMNDVRAGDRYDSRALGPIPVSALSYVFDIAAGSAQ